MSRSLAPLLLLLAGCAPESATLTSGTFRAFLATSTSATVFTHAIDTTGGSSAAEHYQIDCRAQDDKEFDKTLSLPDADTSICKDPLWPPAQEQWLSYDGYDVFADDMDPWRGEGIMTSEGDLEITFHNHLPGSAELRFTIVVKPDFRPQQCVLDENNNVVAQDINGASWLDEWANPEYTLQPALADETTGATSRIPATDLGDGGSFFFLNAGAYQFNPSDLTQAWVLPQAWLAGFAAAKFGAEDFYPRQTLFGEPRLYEAYSLDGSTPTSDELFYGVLTPVVMGDVPLPSAESQSFTSESDTDTIEEGSYTVTYGKLTSKFDIDATNSSLDGFLDALAAKPISGFTASVVDTGSGFALDFRGGAGDVGLITIAVETPTGPGATLALSPTAAKAQRSQKFASESNVGTINPGTYTITYGTETATFTLDDTNNSLDGMIAALQTAMPSLQASAEGNMLVLEDPPGKGGDAFVLTDPAPDPRTDVGYQALIQRTEDIGVEDANELALAKVKNYHAPIVHTNEWREPDGSEAGLDGWAELEYSYVRFDQAATDLAIGNPASGEFSMFMEATSSQSRLILNGKFTIDKIKKDHWMVPDLTAQDLAASGKDLCGNTVAPTQ